MIFFSVEKIYSFLFFFFQINAGFATYMNAYYHTPSNCYLVKILPYVASFSRIDVVRKLYIVANETDTSVQESFIIAPVSRKIQHFLDTTFLRSRVEIQSC